MGSSLTAKPTSASKVVMTQLVLPGDTNALGTIFGGRIMAWADIAGAICSQRHCNKDVVTASMDELHFVAPVHKGWVVNMKASINFVAKTSMEVGVRIEAENPKTGEIFHTATAYMTFVALGSNGKPCEVPGLILETDVDRRRHREAEARRAHRLATRDAKLAEAKASGNGNV